MSEFKDYLIEYQFEGVDWGATVKAASFEDAKRRIEIMGAFGRVKGEVMATAPGWGGPLVRIWCGLANALRLK